jgi:hypothetical protein
MPKLYTPADIKLLKEAFKGKNADLEKSQS